MIYYILFLHFVGDFLCQTTHVHQNKAKSWPILLFHVALYTFILGLGGTFLRLETSTLLLFSIGNGIFHFGIDSIMAPLSNKFYEKGDLEKVRWVSGGEQMLHTACLVATTSLL